MQRFLLQVWQEDDGVLSFEWTLFTTLLAIGIVGGLAAARDAIIDEMGDVANALIHIDQSFTMPGVTIGGIVIPDQGFQDSVPFFGSCERTSLPGQGPETDIDGGP